MAQGGGQEPVDGGGMDETSILRARVAELEARLRDVERRAAVADPTLSSLLLTMSDHVMVLDLDGRVRYMNWTIPEMTLDEVLGRSVLDLVPETSRANIARAFERVRSSFGPERYETEFVDPLGQLTHWESRVTPILHEGALTGFTVASRNVTERRRASEDRDRFFALSLDFLSIADESGHFTHVNPGVEQNLGYTVEEICAVPFIELVHPEDRDETLATFKGLLRGDVVIDFENRYRHKNGTYRTFTWRSTGDPRTKLVYGAARDVTNQRALEAQARVSQKILAVGQLAGGVAHDFNNIVLAIDLNAKVAQDATDAEAKKGALVEIRRAAGRAADLTRQLLMFARHEKPSMSLVSMNQVVHDVMALLRRLIPENIELDFIPGRDLPHVRADAGQLEQVLTNVCLNARDAMPNGGRLSIETESVVINGAYRKTHPWARPGRYVLVTVTDTGHGMSEDVRDRAFEPFFTTKEPGKGTGLGLATVHGIVEAHGGLMHLYSEEGVGTTMKVYVPASERKAAAVGSKLAPAPRGGSETVLVAEDNDGVRMIVGRVLEDAGYKVVTARDGVEAVRIFGERADEIGLVLLDVVMPRRGGPAAFLEIRGLRPTVPVLFTSGYNDDARLADVIDDSAGVLEKPYEPADLLRRVREAIDDHTKGA